MFPVNYQSVRARRNWGRLRYALGAHSLFTRAGENRRRRAQQILARVKGLARQYRATRARGYTQFKYGPMVGYKYGQYKQYIPDPNKKRIF